jgi:eukaryotic-like serine/threonine-protein kinase
VIGPGDVLRNRYQIERSIGRGGMGEVFSAAVLGPLPGRELDIEATLIVPSLLTPRVAIKVVRRSVVSDGAMTRLTREAEAVARIRSPFIPQLIDFGQTAEGELFFAMEILYGETLTARLKARPVLTWEEIFPLGDDVLSALIDAHDAGIIHRDLKPGNIFVCAAAPPESAERAKILDFGVCKVDSTDNERLTGTGESVGTVSYMAPEQIRGASFVTVRADLYSFGTVIFEALCGQLPHAGPGQMALLASKLEKNAVRLSEAAQVHVPEGLEALLTRLLARDPNARFASAMEVRDEWRALGPAIVAPRPSLDIVPTESTRPGSGTILTHTPRQSRLGLSLAIFSIVLSCLALIVIVRVRQTPKPQVMALAAAAPPPPPAPEPLVSARVVDRPALPEVDLTALPTVQDAGFWSGDTGAVVSPWPRPAPAVRAPWRGGAPTKPHIADKPRY